MNRTLGPRHSEGRPFSGRRNLLFIQLIANYKQIPRPLRGIGVTVSLSRRTQRASET